MSVISDTLLLAYRAGALEPHRALEVEEYLARDPMAWARVGSLPALEVASQRWRIPPPGVRGGSMGFGLELRRAEVFGGGTRVGDRFQVVLDAVEPTRCVVVLRRLLGASWEVVFPMSPDDRLEVGELPLEAERAILDLTVEHAGEQDWAVLLPETLPSGDGPDRWLGVLADLAIGRVPVASTRLTARA
jgi:hypothetical protein